MRLMPGLMLDYCQIEGVKVAALTTAVITDTTCYRCLRMVYSYVDDLQMGFADRKANLVPKATMLANVS